MAASTRTTRDQLYKLFDVARRTLHYWWIAAIIVGVGAALSILLALQTDHKYMSETVLLYQEKISQSVLQGREVVESSRKQSERYRELLLARSNLRKLIDEFNLFPDVVEEKGTVAATEILRERISFKDRGAGTFRISYIGDTRKEAQQVTSRLASSLMELDKYVRREQAEQTKAFLEEEKRRAELELKTREVEMAQFLAKHPEFIEDGTGTKAPGSAIRAAQAQDDQKPKGNPQILALERQARRIRARLDNPNGPVVPVRSSRPESQALKDANKEVEAAERTLRDKLSRFTPKHPDVISAQNSLADAKRRLRAVEAEEAAAGGDALPALPARFDRGALEAELSSVQRELAALRAREAGGAAPKTSASDLADELVNLETEYTRMSRRVSEGRERLETLESRVFTADITASSEFSEAASIVTIDEAYLPARPAGRGRGVLAVAGTLVFAALGFGLAIGLALIDDRILRRRDVDDLGIAPVLVVVPNLKTKKRRRRG